MTIVMLMVTFGDVCGGAGMMRVVMNNCKPRDAVTAYGQDSEQNGH